MEPLPPDPYAALGIPKDADPSTIKSTYKKLALKFHPDKVADESKKAEATEKFHKIQRAYDIIGDEDERKRYDAQVKLAQLRRQNFDLRGSGTRVDVRAAGYDIRTAAPPFNAFSNHVPPPRGFTEERRPSFFDDDEPQRGSSRKFDYTFYSYTKRSAPKEKEKEREEKRERVRVSDEERKRVERERRRDADVRESRSRKYATYVVDEEYARIETERRQRDKEEEARRKEEMPRRGSFRGEEVYDDERKYADAQRYMAAQSRSGDDVRPTTYRVSSSREVPYTHVRRTTASPEKTRRSPPRTSPTTLQNQNLASPRESKDSKENLHAPLRSHTTQTDFDSRKQAENDPPPVSIPRARTMPAIPTLYTAKKTESKYSQPSRGRPTETAAQLDSTYASAAPTEGQYPYKQYSPPPPQAQPSTSYTYSKQATNENTTPRNELGNKFDKYTASASYRVELRQPGSSSRRVPSPQREREVKPSVTAAKMAHLAGGNSRAHTLPTSRPSNYSPYTDAPPSRPSMVQRSSSRSIPRVSRSPEPITERVRDRDRERMYERDRSRDRSRDRDRDRHLEKLYGEMGPGYVRSSQANSNSFIEDGVKYSRRPRPEDVIYSSRGRRGSRDGPVYDGQRLPRQFSRSATMPAVYAGI